jgi:glycosyltransferase involved in cell wall biosynthesis
MAAQLLEELARRGHRIEAIAPVTESGAAAAARIDRESGLAAVQRFTMPYLDGSPDTPPLEDYRERERRMTEELLSAAVREHRPDVLVAGRESFAGYVAQVDGAPKVLFVQGATLAGIANGSYPRRLAEELRAEMREFDLVVTSAEPARQGLVDLGVEDARVVPNPVDLTRFRPDRETTAMRSALGLDDADRVVTHPSNLKLLKRPLDLVLAAERALSHDDRLQFVIAGEGPLRTPMIEACSDRGLSDRFRFPGWLVHRDMPALLCSSDMVAMPSEAEAQALVYLETQACARTLIASDIPAARQVVEHGRTGMLFPVGDTEALAAIILRCAGDPDLRARIGTEARDRVQRHSITLVADDYERLLQGLR